MAKLFGDFLEKWRAFLGIWAKSRNFAVAIEEVKMRLSDLPQGHSGVIVKVLGHGAFRKRMIEMGFIKGQTVEVLQHAPLKDPIKYSIMGYELSLRRSEAELVIVSAPPSDRLKGGATDERGHDGSAVLEAGREGAAPLRGEINIALVGNPNCGKTSLFNIASGAREHVGNYSGVTVDAKEGSFVHRGYRFNMVDLPGTYSMSAYSPEELYVREYLANEVPDVIVNVVVASNLERNLYLTTELIDMDRSMVIALNMYDELEHAGDKLDYRTLGGMIGVPVVPTVTRTGRGVDKLLDTIIDVYEGRDKDVRHIHVKLSPEIEESVTVLRRALGMEVELNPRFSTRYLAIKLLEGDPDVTRHVGEAPGGKAVITLRDQEVKRLERLMGEDVASAIADEKYGFISGALAETLTRGEKDANNPSRIIDAFVTNKLFGFPIFLAIMFVMFWATFYLGAFPMEWIEDGVAWLGRVVGEYMPEGWLKDLIADGIIGGVGGVIVFLPNILILYFCISFMEDSGYMARAAFIMDRLMHRIGLHGKSFIPLVMGFGCNVPAVMACRSIESRSSRLITVLINPFMSCSARLPIYVLLSLAFFPDHAAVAFLGLYLLGIVVAMVTARLMRRLWLKADVTPFVMELPPYRIPTFKASMRHTWGKGQQYLRKMGGVILIASIVVWALNYFPRHEESEQAGREGAAPLQSEVPSLEHDSYLEMMGKAVNPVMEPAGFHWRATVAAIAGVPAKEIVVSTLGVLYTGDEDVTDEALAERIKQPSPVTGQPDFTLASALAFMVFILLYCPCIATVTAIVKETGSWKYGAFSVIYNTLVAWVLAFATYHIAQWLA